MRVNPSDDWLDIEADADPRVSWINPDNDVTQLIDEGVTGGDLVAEFEVEVEVDANLGVS